MDRFIVKERKMNKTQWRHNNQIDKNNRTSRVGSGLALGFAIGTALGAGLGLVFDDFGLGMILGAWAGLAIGLAIGATLDERIKD